MVADGPDVVVAGGGPGGLAAALQAASEGLSVVLLEARDDVGGNAARSTGYMAFVASAEQAEAGIEDSDDAFLQDCRREVQRQRDRYGIVFDEPLTRKFIRESRDTYTLLVDLGFRFDRLIRRPEAHRTHRMLAVDDVGRFRTTLGAAVRDAGVTIRTQTRALRLLRKDGGVGGVIAACDASGGGNGDGALERIPARATVLACGGYQANARLRRRYQPERYADSPYLGIDTARGEGHLLGQSVGGDLINMTMIPPLVMVGSGFVEDAIAVNAEGRRFHDEAGPYDDRIEALLVQPGERAHYVCDAVVAARRSELIAQMPASAVAASTLHGLAEAIEVDPAGLEATVAGWNRLLATDAPSDPEFGRGVLPADRHGIHQAPFHAVPMVLGANFPAGGLRVDLAMRALDVFGEPIDGLFAVGDCVGGINPASGLGGMHINSAMTMGRVAARAIARGADQELSGDLPPEPDDAPAPTASGLRIPVVDTDG